MSGHSKWSTIKRKKAANDAKRGKVFTRLSREITIAARAGGDPESNAALGLAIDKAKAENMPKDNIDRAIKRGTGELKDAEDIAEILYEAYGPQGVALIIEVATDNRNRTLADIKHRLNKVGGSMAEPGSVAWQFEQKGYIAVTADGQDYDEIFMLAAEAGAEDVSEDDGLFEIFTPRDELHTVFSALKEAGIQVEEARLDWVPKTEIELEAGPAMKVMNLIEELEDGDDTQMVYSNLRVTDELMAAFEEG
ncbi:MAG TPA: YebC/PmpR family DNA-binding transcriptional regulator [Aggregatilineales bacterium]|nr:YebC/PmpR family DNA-binding transcriptional regulator [Aggregatilineales bacterium]